MVFNLTHAQVAGTAANRAGARDDAATVSGRSGAKPGAGAGFAAPGAPCFPR
jgi:hypothetical protein